jgi:hypothetical protein
MNQTLMALALMTPADLPPSGLDALRWAARPILVFASEDDARLDRQIARFEANGADLENRRNVVIVDTGTGGALRARFKPAGFTVILLGLDGGEKFRSDRVIDPDRLDALIDRMPMRRRELGAAADQSDARP